MASRYTRNRVFRNREKIYKNLFEDRGISHINQFATPTLRHPDQFEISRLAIKEEVWTVGSRLYKYAHEYYGDSSLWWVIAWFNKKPTEAHYKQGDIVFIPLPLDQVYEMLGI